MRFPDGSREQVQVVRTDPRRDLALLQSSFTAQPSAPIGDARSLRPAEGLLAVGYPRSLDLGAQDASVTSGIFSALWQSPRGVWYVQTNALVNRGNSGGPLADGQGSVIGVVTWGVNDSPGLNFAVASDEVLAFLAGGDAPPPPTVPSVPANTQPPSTPSAPSNVWTVILHGDLSSEAEALNRVRKAATDFPDTGVLLSTNYPNLRPGFWVVYAGKYDNESSAARAASSARDKGYPGAYPRWLGQEPPPTIGTSREVPTTAVPSPASSRDDPADAVQQFYAHIGSRNFQAAWQMLGPSFRAKNEYNGWVKGFESTRSVQTSSATTTSQSGDKAVVDITINSVDAIGSRTEAKTFGGSWDLVRVDGAWKLETPHIRQTN